jgi:hypothetical protein
MCGCADVRMCQCADVPMCGCADVPMCGCANVRMCGCADVNSRLTFHVSRLTSHDLNNFIIIVIEGSLAGNFFKQVFQTVFQFDFIEGDVVFKFPVHVLNPILHYKRM